MALSWGIEPQRPARQAGVQPLNDESRRVSLIRGHTGDSGRIGPWNADDRAENQKAPVPSLWEGPGLSVVWDLVEGSYSVVGSGPGATGLSRLLQYSCPRSRVPDASRTNAKCAGLLRVEVMCEMRVTEVLAPMFGA